MSSLKENCNMLYNEDFYNIKIGENNYSLKGHSNCIVTIWENEYQVALMKRSNSKIGNGFEEIEVLYEKQIPLHIMILFSVFGWERFVGTIDANRTFATISLTKDAIDTNWRPKE
jgi:hypothetical protein